MAKRIINIEMFNISKNAINIDVYKKNRRKEEEGEEGGIAQ